MPIKSTSQVLWSVACVPPPPTIQSVLVPPYTLTLVEGANEPTLASKADVINESHPSNNSLFMYPRDLECDPQASFWTDPDGCPWTIRHTSLSIPFLGHLFLVWKPASRIECCVTNLLAPPFFSPSTYTNAWLEDMREDGFREWSASRTDGCNMIAVFVLLDVKNRLLTRNLIDLLCLVIVVSARGI